MRFQKSSLLLLLSSPLGLFSQDTIVPEIIQSTEVQQIPFKYNGLLYVQNAIGSASMVGQGIFATAAHVVFDDDSLSWASVGSTSYYPQHNRTLTFNPQGTAYQPVAFSRWTSYSTRVQEDKDNGTPVGQSTPNTFNIDFAVGYLNKFVSKTEVLEHAEVHVDLEEEVGIFRDEKIKMIVGYPANSTYISTAARGKMHKTEPDDYFCWWGGLTDLEQTWRDSEDFWVAMYNFEGVTTYGGNSGGPMYIQDVEDEWSFGGIIVGSDSEEGIIVRGVDEGAWSMIQEAINNRDVQVPQRIDDLEAISVSPDAVTLAWSDANDKERGFYVFRNEDGSWVELASLPEDTEFYEDASVEPGHVYQYRVQPFAENGNRPPKSPALLVHTPGSNTKVANSIGQWALKFKNDGQSNWYIDSSNRLRAGKARSLGNSSLGLEILGPGTLSFTWSVSSELNLDYSNPDSPNEGDIYDAIFLYMDGQQVMNGNEPAFLSGTTDQQEFQLAVPEGEHLIEWVYQKDPYTSEGEDTGFLDSLSWFPGPTNAYPVYGGFSFPGSDWHGSAWFGNYFTEHYPWIGHTSLGWLFLQPGDGYNLYVYSVLPEFGNMYTTPFYYPYFYRQEQEDWIYVYPNTGSFGSDLWYFDLDEAKAIYLP